MSGVNVCNPQFWSWFYDQKSDRFGVTVVTDDGNKYQGFTAYKGKNLSNEAKKTHIPFTKRDVELYLNFYERFSDLNLTSAERLMCAINATAVNRFHIQLPVVSGWFQNVGCRKAPEIGEVVITASTFLNKEGKSQEGDFVVVETDDVEQTCYALLINKNPLKVQKGIDLICGTYVRLEYNQLIHPSSVSTNLFKTLNIA